MSLPNIDKIVASKGTKLVNDTTEVTATIAGIFVLEDTVFNAIKVAGSDVKSTYITTAATAIKAGALITGVGVNFSGVKLTSGSVNLILG
ncbi:hypothetical protein UFOVP207_11 [uncultured Caudovirales phage]|uniref:Uncharacterized protein n=1 Tax=uncultured Caudovirales phage TaxID=2100421 RepID=A0A6J7WQI2_9CAUD|nr:hypothetical protein UFOVP207_11 [uncultured Caudovirales phage]